MSVIHPSFNIQLASICDRATCCQRLSNMHLPLVIQHTSVTNHPIYVYHCSSKIHLSLVIQHISATDHPIYVCHCSPNMHLSLVIQHTSVTDYPIYVCHCSSNIHLSLVIHHTSVTDYPIYVCHWSSNIYLSLVIHHTSVTAYPIYVCHWSSNIHLSLVIQHTFVTGRPTHASLRVRHSFICVLPFTSHRTSMVIDLFLSLYLPSICLFVIIRHPELIKSIHSSLLSTIYPIMSDLSTFIQSSLITQHPSVCH